ncbi:STAS/SEC14 domain-containing protein [Roseisolibacter sp. H3M3-2]|uniref:STAS/SEC14 domain-containing protein n=1 Tax=Roseisolibacter sp. H3M3-2 TaxID=3031323 RepID=UPI0023DB3286|nr:STAS/SEC14 domain-containing protein [Roseisolibacter sp. H3M3-2]MDF1505857.1 STAS/SEC14 domain-containing protein [Roseisolibacter sp. H3M3-2]
MPITFRVDRAARLIRAEVEGAFSAEDMIRCVADAAEAVGREPGWHILSDHRRIGTPSTRPQVEQLVARLEALRDTFAGSRWAVVVGSPASYGMMRMLGMLAEGVPMTVRPFEDADAAEGWARTGAEAAGA